MEKKKSKPCLDVMEAKQQCPKMVKPIPLPPLLDKDDLTGKGQVLIRALKKETEKLLMEKKKITDCHLCGRSRFTQSLLELTPAYIEMLPALFLSFHWERRLKIFQLYKACLSDL